MSGLNEEHPDFGCKPGDKRECGGKEYTYGENQYSHFWRAGPKDGTVHCSKDFPHASDNPYTVRGVTCATFERAAERARRGARDEYDRALAVVKRYEAEK